jgi:hypothetical protein
MEEPWDNGNIDAKAVAVVKGGDMGIILYASPDVNHESFVMLRARFGWLYNADLEPVPR